MGRPERARRRDPVLVLTRNRLAAICLVGALTFGIVAIRLADSPDTRGELTSIGPTATSDTIAAATTSPDTTMNTTSASSDTASAETTTSDTAAGGSTATCAATSAEIAVGRNRSVTVRSPATTTLVPAVIVLHGYTGSPDAIEATSGWTQFANSRGALVAYPRGTPTPSEGYGWATGTARFSTSGVDDVAFLDSVIDMLIAEHCVDPARVLITGESNGGAMTLLAGCRLRHRPVLAAPVIPAIDEGTLEACGTGAAFPVLALAGKLDKVIPYDGTYAEGVVPLLGQEEWFTDFATARNGCREDLERRTANGSETIDGGACGASTRLIAIDDGRHTWPGGPEGTGGLDPGEFAASATIWAAAGFDGDA